jgi:ribosomal-protein-alanine N-acetyltransferase
MFEAPVLYSERLELTPLEDADREPLREVLSLEPVRRYLLDGNEPDREWVESVVADSKADFARAGLGLWAARRPRQPALIGFVGYRQFRDPPIEEVLYALHPGAWGQGFATELAHVVIGYAFTEAGRDRVVASIDLPNEASHRAMGRENRP